MKQRFLALLVLVVGLVPVSAQTPASVEVKVKYGLIEKIWSILLRPKTVLSDFTCDMTEMEPGDTATCTISLNQPARGNTTVLVVVPAGFIGPPSVLFARGVQQMTISIVREELVGALGPQVVPMGWAEYIHYGAVRLHAHLVIPCCARTDLCQLRPEQVPPCVAIA